MNIILLKSLAAKYLPEKYQNGFCEMYESVFRACADNPKLEMLEIIIKSLRQRETELFSDKFDTISTLAVNNYFGTSLLTKREKFNQSRSVIVSLLPEDLHQPCVTIFDLLYNETLRDSSVDIFNLISESVHIWNELNSTLKSITY